MSGRLCCYKQQQHSKLLTRFVFKVSALIQFVPSCQDTRTQFVDVLDPPFSDICMQHYAMLSRRIFCAENIIVTKFCHLALGVPVILPHRVYSR